MANNISSAQALENYQAVLNNKRWYNSHPILHIGLVLIIIMPMMFFISFSKTGTLTRYFPWLITIFLFATLDFVIFCVIIDSHRRQQLRNAVATLVVNSVFEETGNYPVNLWPTEYNATFELGAMSLDFRVDKMKYRIKGRKEEFSSIIEALEFANEQNSSIID